MQHTSRTVFTADVLTQPVKIPDRLFRILESCQAEDASHFPATEVFNEGWMLRLTLDAMESLKIANHPLQFSNGAKWYSEARMSSPFRPRVNSDPLGEGFTNVDGIIGHFEFRPPTKTGLQLKPGGQFVIVEARTFNTSVLHPWLSIHRTWVGICRCFGKNNDQAMD